jgi:Ras-related protein Rab-13
MFSPRQQIKLIIVGDSLTGKTTIINNYYLSKFINNSNIELYSKIININNIDIYCNAWDIKGDYSYNNITNSYLKEPNAFIILFDITNLCTFTNISNWLERIYKYNKIINNYNYYPILLLGNKCDLELKRKISYNEAQKFALKNKLLYLEVSTYNNDKIITSINTYIYNVYDFIYNDKKDFIYSFNLEDTQNIVSNNNIKLSKSIEDMNNLNNVYKNNHLCPPDCNYCISKRNNKKSCSLL